MTDCICVEVRRAVLTSIVSLHKELKHIDIKLYSLKNNFAEGNVSGSTALSEHILLQTASETHRKQINHLQNVYRQASDRTLTFCEKCSRNTTCNTEPETILAGINQKFL